jgi:hypothetical protein
LLNYSILEVLKKIFIVYIIADYMTIASIFKLNIYFFYSKLPSFFTQGTRFCLRVLDDVFCIAFLKSCSRFRNHITI